MSWKAVWPGYSPSLWPPDAQIAVSSSHVIVGFNGAAAFYDRTGTPVGCVGTPDLFSPLSLPTTPHPVKHYDDLRLAFDGYRKRFMMLSSAGANANEVPDYIHNRPYQVLAVSVSQNPLDGWYLYWWDAAVGYTEGTPPSGSVYVPSDAPDDPNLGVSPTLIVATCIIVTPCTQPSPGQTTPPPPCSQYFPPTSTHPYWHAVFLDAKQLSQGLPGPSVAGWHYWDITNPDGSRRTLIPAMHHGPGNATWLVSAENAATKFAVFRLMNANALTSQHDFQSTEVALNTSVYPKNEVTGAPQQPDSAHPSPPTITMSNFGGDAQKAVFRSPYLYVVAEDSRKWGAASADPNHPLQPSIRFTRVRAVDFPNINIGSGYVDRLFGGGHPGDKPDITMGYGWPAVEVNNKHDTVIVYARSGVSIHPEVRYSAWLSADPDIRSSNRLKLGEGVAGSGKAVRWGDTGGASVDPVDDNGIWITQQYANKSGSADLWVGKIFGSGKR